jgi:hypothetical protein
LVVSVGVKVAVMREVPAAPSVTVAPEMVAVAVVADVYVNIPGRESATVGAVKLKGASPRFLETLAKFERLGVALDITVKLNA